MRLEKIGFMLAIIGMVLLGGCIQQREDISVPVKLTDKNDRPIDINVGYIYDVQSGVTGSSRAGLGGAGSFSWNMKEISFPLGAKVKMDLDVTDVVGNEVSKCKKSQTFIVGKDTMIYQRFDCYVNKQYDVSCTECLEVGTAQYCGSICTDTCNTNGLTYDFAIGRPGIGNYNCSCSCK